MGLSLKHLRLPRYLRDCTCPRSLRVSRQIPLSTSICLHMDATIVPTVQQAITLFGPVLVDVHLPVGVKGSMVWSVPDVDSSYIWRAGTWESGLAFVLGYGIEYDVPVFFARYKDREVVITEDFWMYNDLRTAYAGGPTGGPYIGIDARVFLPTNFPPHPDLDLDRLLEDARSQPDADDAGNPRTGATETGSAGRSIQPQAIYHRRRLP